VPDADDGASESASGKDAGRLYGRWYYDTYTVPYNENEHWRTFFGQVADNIISQLAPRTVLDAGCAKGFLVGALRERGVDASGFDISEYAVDDAPEVAKAHVRVGSLTDPIEGRYDLVTCIEVIEHLDPADASTAVANLCSASDAVLLSSTPNDQDEVTHVNVQPPERWSQLFATNGFFRDFRHEAAYLSPWAVLYRRGSANVGDVVLDYDRAWSQLRKETVEQRRSLLALQEQLEQLARTDELEHEAERLGKEVLRLRDLVVGKEAELGTALGRVAELEALIQRYGNLEQHLDAVLNSRSWRLMWAAGTPIRRMRGAK
jgi:2-polyprenyl-3-methyl-5-hydroxy-6-metoxy-1,4-benzoquinol methylase